MRASIRRKLLISHFVAVVLVSGSVGTYFYNTAVNGLFEGLRARLRYSAGLLSRTLDSRELHAIRTSEDVRLPEYQRNLILLREFEAANPDIAYIYVMRMEGDRVVFVLDSDPTEDQALPGEEYPDPPPKMLRGFSEQAADDRIYEDQWGYFLSGYAPLKHGDGRYLVGIDMRADEVQSKLRTIRTAGLASLVASVVLAYLLSMWLAARITRPIRALVLRSGEIAGGVLDGRVEVTSGDELAELAQAFNSMSERLAASHAENRSSLLSLEEAREQLEQRVAERTASLTETNEKLQQEVAERTRAEAALEQAAATDYLTGLANRRAVIGLMELEMGRYRRTQRPFSLLLADLDHFKAINDRLGHEAGDRVLTVLAQRLREGVRSQDVVARWGGDELLIFMPETWPDEAVEAAERLRRLVTDTPVEICNDTVVLSLSIGVCAMTPSLTIDECVRRADLALLQAKTEGRDQVVFAG